MVVPHLGQTEETEKSLSSQSSLSTRSDNSFRKFRAEELVTQRGVCWRHVAVLSVLEAHEKDLENEVKNEVCPIQDGKQFLESIHATSQ